MQTISILGLLALAVAIVYHCRLLTSRQTIKQKAKSSLPEIQPLPSFDWRVESPRKLRPFKSVYNITMGVYHISLHMIAT